MDIPESEDSLEINIYIIKTRTNNSGSISNSQFSMKNKTIKHLFDNIDQ